MIRPRPMPPGLRPTRCTRPRRRWAAGCSARRPIPSTAPRVPRTAGCLRSWPRTGNSLRRSARLLSLAASAGDETVRAQMRLVLRSPGSPGRSLSCGRPSGTPLRPLPPAGPPRNCAPPGALRTSWSSGGAGQARPPRPSGSAWTSRSRRARPGPEPGRKPARTGLGHVPHTGRQHPPARSGPIAVLADTRDSTAGRTTEIPQRQPPA